MQKEKTRATFTAALFSGMPTIKVTALLVALMLFVIPMFGPATLQAADQQATLSSTQAITTTATSPVAIPVNTTTIPAATATPPAPPTNLTAVVIVAQPANAAPPNVAHGPSFPPDPWDGKTIVAHGPTFPPDPWDGKTARMNAERARWNSELVVKVTFATATFRL